MNRAVDMLIEADSLIEYLDRPADQSPEEATGDRS
jgi:hypothetical protein